VFAQRIDIGVQLPLSEVRSGSSFYGSGGAGVAERGVASFHINPAAFEAAGAYATIEGLWQKRTKWIANIDRLSDRVLPTRAVVMASLDGFAVGFGYEHEMDDRLDLGYIPITTVDAPDGTGQFYRLVMSSRLQSAYMIGQTSNGYISLGFLAGISRFAADELFANATMDGKGNGFVAGAGFILPISDEFTLGGAFRFHSKIEAQLVWKMNSIDSIWTAQHGTLFAPIPSPTRVTVESPTYGQIGIAFSPSEEILLLGSVEYRKWYSFTSTDANGVLNLHVGLRWKPMSSFAFRTGFFTYNDPRDVADASIAQQFITVGLDWTPVSPVTVSVSLLDSDLLASDIPATSLFTRPYAQTELTAGISILLGR
jgi:hypothetical protein